MIEPGVGTKFLTTIKKSPVWLLGAVAISSVVFLCVPEFRSAVSPDTQTWIKITAVLSSIFAICKLVSIMVGKIGETRSALRQHHLSLLADWHTMIADVTNSIKEAAKRNEPLNEGEIRRLLELHPKYPSFLSAYRNYMRKGLRGLKSKFLNSPLYRNMVVRSPFRRKLIFLGEGRLLASGTDWPPVLHLTVDHIAEIKRWWGID
jgi:hypothetical protein